MDNVVELVGGGSVINGAYPVQFILLHCSYIARYLVLMEPDGVIWPASPYSLIPG